MGVAELFVTAIEIYTRSTETGERERRSSLMSGSETKSSTGSQNVRSPYERDKLRMRSMRGQHIQ